MTAELDFTIGRAGTGKTHACLAAMRQRMAEAPMGPALILLLPEHMTFKVERELAESIPKDRASSGATSSVSAALRATCSWKRGT